MMAAFPRTAPADTFKVAMLVSSASEEGEAAAAAIQSHLSDLPVELVIEKTEGISFDVVKLHTIVQEIAARVQSRVVFFADFRDPNRTVLFVSIPKVGTTLIRHIDCQDETLISRYEATAVIIRGILVAMLGGGEIGIHVPPVPPKDTVKEQPETAAPKETKPTSPKAGAKKKASETESSEGEAAGTSRRASRFQVETSYTLGLRFSDQELMTHALRIGFLRFVGKGAFLFAAYRFTLPFNDILEPNFNFAHTGEDGQEDTDTIIVRYGLTVALHPIEVGAGMRWQWGAVDLHLGAALMVDVISWRSILISRESDSSGISVDADPSPRAEVGWRMGLSLHTAVGWRITDATTFYLAFLADFLAYKKDFKVSIGVSDNSPSKWTLSKLNFINPGVQVGLRFTL